MLRSPITRASLALTILVLAAGVLSSQASAASATPPHIVAKPDNLMVNTKTTLTGTGFPKNTKLTIAECSTTFWIVPTDPCVHTNQISVRTDAHGRFTGQLRVVLCGGKRGPEPTSQICYIGEPRPKGIDTMRLVGVAKITVTYP